MDKRPEIMNKMFMEGMTLQQIGDQFGISRERVRQLIQKVNPSKHRWHPILRGSYVVLPCQICGGDIETKASYSPQTCSEKCRRIRKSGHDMEKKEVAQFFKKLMNQGLSEVKIGRMLGIAQGTVSNHLRFIGAGPGRGVRKWDYRAVYEEWKKSDRRTSQVAKKFHTSSATVIRAANFFKWSDPDFTHEELRKPPKWRRELMAHMSRTYPRDENGRIMRPLTKDPI